MTHIAQLYKNPIDRPLNPAVSAEDFSDKTVETEIMEYVFTDEIINGLYNTLNAIRTQNVSHNGIWISGSFGSGKSHFLKFLGYCIDARYREKALARLAEAVKERDPLTVDDTMSTVTIDDMNQLSAWLRKATVDVVLFNIGTVHDTNADQKEVFTQVFWNQFNRFRGYNSFKLALAQYLEKALDEAGKFGEFKQRLAAEGHNWADPEQACTLATIKLDHILEIAKELVPILTVDSIHQAIVDDKVNVSPEAFCLELQAHVDRKNDKDYRLLFLVDEVSQFISNRGYLLLQLQQVVTGLHRYCNDKVWVACTAQQDLSQLMDNMQIQKTSDDYGKIMGRFEVRVSLKGAQTEYITQKRLLDKNDGGAQTLRALWADKHLAVEDQFAALPSSFNSYKNEKEFVDYYPFVPYQFPLIQKVLDSFNALHYIDSQARGNERSIIKITHTTANKSKDDEVGCLISFDKFYNAMFEGSLMAAGQRAIGNANAMIKEYGDRDFAQRVVNVLFMICNLSAPDKLLFPATQEHIVTLLMQDADTNKAALIDRTEKALAFLDQKHIIRTEKFSDGRADIYCFQSEDEIEAAREIESMAVDQATMAVYLEEMFRRHFRLTASANKETYCSRSFSIGWQIYGRNFLANNADINVEFAIGKPAAAGTLFGTNEPNRLTFNIQDDYAKDKLLVNDFFWFCQVQKWTAEKTTDSATRDKTRAAFGERALQLRDRHIAPKFNAILNRCPILSGNTVISVSGEGAARYKAALEVHFGNVYPYAKLAVGTVVPSTVDELRSKIARPVAPGEYGPLNPITEPERQIDQHIRGQFGTVYVSAILRSFAARPYGWSETATAYFLNELRRRGLWTLKFGNDAGIDSKFIAQSLIREQGKYTVVAATSIPQKLVNDFIAAWKYVLNSPSVPNCYDSGELFRLCKETQPGEKHLSIGSILRSFNEQQGKLAAYPFAGVLTEAIALLNAWNAERDHKKFFELVIADRDRGREIFDRYKVLKAFVDDHLPAYRALLAFVGDNEENFQYLADEDRQKADELRGIVTDPWPIPNMKKYAQLKNRLAQALDEVMRQTREQIKHQYEVVFDDLRQVCDNACVEYNIDEPAVLQQKTASNKMYVLAGNLKTDDYRAEQVQLIMNRRTSGTGDGPHKEPARRIRMVSLHTGSTTPLNTEADVDHYLARLKAELMKVVNTRQENDDIMVK